MIVNDLFESAYAGNTERAVARNMNRPVVDEQGVAEGEVVPFKRPQQQAITWKQLPKNVLRLANDWYWADQDDSGADAVMDPKGFGSGTANELKYITAKLQQEGWSIDYNDEHDAPGEYNLRLTNRRGQSVLLPIEDAQDFTGWAKGTSSMTEQGVAEGSDVEYIVVIRDKQGKRSIRVSALTPTDAKEKAEAQGYKVLKVKDPREANYFREQGVAEVVHPDVTSKKYFIEPTENVRMGEFEFNARTFTGGLSDPNARGLQIRAYDPEQPKGQNLIGSTDFIVKSDKKGNQWLESDDTEVNDEYRGKGVAAMMYAFAKSLGNDIKSSPYQSQKGREMWRKWGTDAKHLAGKKGVAEGSLEEIDRRGFLRGMGAAALAGVAGGAMAQSKPTDISAELSRMTKDDPRIQHNKDVNDLARAIYERIVAERGQPMDRRQQQQWLEIARLKAEERFSQYAPGKPSTTKPSAGFPSQPSEYRRSRNLDNFESVDQGVAEGLNDTVYPNAEVIKSKNGKPVGEIYQDGNGWGCFHYRADRGYDTIDSREDAIQALKDIHGETARHRPDYTVKGVAEGLVKEFAGDEKDFGGGGEPDDAWIQRKARLILDYVKKQPGMDLLKDIKIGYSFRTNTFQITGKNKNFNQTYEWRYVYHPGDKEKGIKPRWVPHDSMVTDRPYPPDQFTQVVFDEEIREQGVAEGEDDLVDLGPALRNLTGEFNKFMKHDDRMKTDPAYAKKWNKRYAKYAGNNDHDIYDDPEYDEQGVAEGIFGSKENSAVPLVNKIAQVARQLTPQNVNVGKQIIQSNADDILRMMSPQAKTGIEVIEQGVAEAGPFSYGKAPRKGSIADLAAKKRKEQEQGKQPVEPKDQMVGVAKVKKGVAESINAMIKQATSREDLRQIRNFVAEHVTDVNRQRKIMEQATQIVAVQRRVYTAKNSI